MASTDAAKDTEEVPPTGDNKPSSTHYENAEAGVKVTDFEGERVIVTQQDVSPSLWFSNVFLMLTIPKRAKPFFAKLIRRFW
jgi:hypothetical protein